MSHKVQKLVNSSIVFLALFTKPTSQVFQLSEKDLNGDRNVDTFKMDVFFRREKTLSGRPKMTSLVRFFRVKLSQIIRTSFSRFKTKFKFETT